ncbi:hypothetical protein BAUCODRAFT_151912 [Baudoinia panamericana UAMH 10762]|uniref:Uncharacterized protein n=1 Tax=Baudoinia panamericana (strain UAMH 10762) TaxID=717646 RepID=M2N0W3_BAUPA|nr:uncharacterized protein BAUCODRAFT_151912 [Baudoinia panamericana UAMH 10762]EMC92539.1 hypothetical protein BAUCODRAFT_151912 [Baudoinia panamericana UAMH 10762]
MAARTTASEAGGATKVTKLAAPKKETTSRSPRTDFSDLPGDRNQWKVEDLKDQCRSRKLGAGGKEIKATGPRDADAGDDQVVPKKRAKSSGEQQQFASQTTRKKKAPINGYRAMANETEKAEPADTVKATKDQIDRAKRHYAELLAIIQQIQADNGEDYRVFATVIAHFGRAKKGLSAVKKAESIEEPVPRADPEIGPQPAPADGADDNSTDGDGMGLIQMTQTFGSLKRLHPQRRGPEKMLMRFGLLRETV